MFMGLIQGLFRVAKVEKLTELLKLSIELDKEFVANLQLGASVAVNGTCLTVASLDHHVATFDVIQETLDKTTLGQLAAGQLVNVERAARFGDEIGGHVLSGHIYCVGEITEITQTENTRKIFFKLPKGCIRYLFSKGYVAIDGISLTVVDVNPDQHTFSVCLIPETIKRTNLGSRQHSERVNIEIDFTTQVIVDTIDRRLKNIEMQ